MSLECSILAVFDDEATELAVEYHMEETCDDFTTAMRWRWRPLTIWGCRLMPILAPDS